jgi:hypothetical protein
VKRDYRATAVDGIVENNVDSRLDPGPKLARSVGGGRNAQNKTVVKRS